MALGSAVVLVTVVSLWGASRMASATLLREGTPLTVGLVQGNIAQDEKWDAAYEDAILAKYLRLSHEAVTQGATFILWPESAVPFYFESDAKSERIREFARTHGTSLLIGGDRVSAPVAARVVQRRVHAAPGWQHGRRVPEGAPRSVRRIRTGQASAVLCRAARRGRQRLRARRRAGDAGARRTARINTAICYEVVYPALIREGVRHWAAAC